MPRLTVAARPAGAVRLHGPAFDIDVGLAPARLELHDRSGPFWSESRPAGLFVVRSGQERSLVSLRPRAATGCATTFDATFDDGTTGAVSLRLRTPRTLKVSLAVDHPEDVTEWGERVVTPPGEFVSGLMERIVDDWVASEVAPQETGTLDLKGQRVTMYVHPTMSVYAPFYLTASGYGLLVDGTMPGSYDLGATTPDVLRFAFERAPGSAGGAFSVFYGRAPATILDEYTHLVGRPPRPPAAVFTHWLGHDELPAGPPVVVDGVALNPTLAADLDTYERYGIPPGIYHFDRPWAVGTDGYGALRFDSSRFPDPEGMLRLLRRRGWRIEVWVSEWVLDERAATAAANGWLAPGSTREPDLTNAAARRWFADGFRAFLRGDEGRAVDGFFVDRTDEVVPSSSTDRYADGRTGREVHNAYPVMTQQVLAGVLHDERPRSGWLLARASYTGSSRLILDWGGDTRSREGIPVPEQPDTGPPTDRGLRSVIISMQRAALLGLPYWGSDIGGYSEFASRDLYARWIELGAFSPLMRFHGKGHHVPWDMPTEPRVDDGMIAIYRRYVLLHDALSGYLDGLARKAHAHGSPLVRPLTYAFPGDADAARRWDEFLLGPDLLVAPVWRTGDRTRDVYVPRGRWVDLWDHGHVVTGPATVVADAPLDRIPVFVAAGSPLLRIPVPG